MKINYLSDIHNEFGVLMHELEGDVLILAGDIHVRGNVDWINEAASHFTDVIYVAGNHEYYRRRIDKIDRIIREKVADNIHFLQNESVVLNGVTFHGTTLWTNFNDADPLSMMEAESQMNDFKIITYKDHGGNFHRFRARNALTEFSVAKIFLENNVKEGDVVVTHMAPSFLSIHEKYKGDKLNGAFASDLSNLILDTKPILWFHGHVHTTFDYMIGDTRVLCNPRGYVGYQDENPDFNLNAFVEI